MDKNQNRIKEPKKPWPTQAVMDQIYEQKLWGGSGSDFYSGDGSHEPSIVQPYVKAVGSFLCAFEEPLSVCDLGCGDFNVGKELFSYTQQYVAVDIVSELIDRNRAQFKAQNLEFHCLDIAKDDLPKADCAILRQVLQHLSNTEVHRIVDKLCQYKYVMLTEHIPEGKFIPNVDIISGQGIRLKKKSGIDLLAPPFDFKVKNVRSVLAIPSRNNRGVISTKLFAI